MQGLLEDDLWKSLWSHCYALPPYSEGGKVDVLATTKGKSIVDSYLCYLAWHLSPVSTEPYERTIATDFSFAEKKQKRKQKKAS